jgi:hypothetical protein
MARIVAMAVLAAGLAACAPGGAEDAAAPGGGRTAANPFEFCRSQGLAVDSEAFEECVAEAIEQRCAAAGAPGSDAHARCVQQQRDATFVRDQLQIRGF